jgi:hypothetical protein
MRITKKFTLVTYLSVRSAQVFDLNPYLITGSHRRRDIIGSDDQTVWRYTSQSRLLKLQSAPYNYHSTAIPYGANKQNISYKSFIVFQVYSRLPAGYG